MTFVGTLSLSEEKNVHGPFSHLFSNILAGTVLSSRERTVCSGGSEDRMSDNAASENDILEVKITYFRKPGKENTDKVFNQVKSRAKELGISTILVASTHGDSAARAAEFLDGFRVIAVSHASGMPLGHSGITREPNFQPFTMENRKSVEAKGGIVLTMSHAFRGGASSALRKKFKMQTESDIMADTLRIFGQGMKVVVEIVMMAADAGLVSTDEQVISVAGTGRGADTAVVLKPVNTPDFFDMRIKEIICKPYF